MSRPLRFTCILGLVALAIGLAAAGGWRYARASAPVNGPIILVSLEAVRADHLPAYGYHAIATPAIDALAADGVVFERAYAHAPSTLAAHASMMSGRLPFENGVRDDSGFPMKDAQRTLAERLRDRGFATGAVVSNYALRRDTGIGRGFSFFDDRLDTSPDDGIDELQRSGAVAEEIAEHWLEGKDTSRLFLLLHIDEQTPRGSGDAADRLSAYDAGIVRADAAVGRLIRYLKSHQLYDRSTIILVSDHGEGLGDHGESGHGLFVYDEVLRVPLVIKRAAGEGAGKRISSAVQHVDLVPTILDLAKAPSATGLAGRSLSPQLDGRPRDDRRMIYGESLFAYYHLGGAMLSTVTDGRYRYIRAPREELYDLESDPQARQNLAARPASEIPPVIDELRHELKQFGTTAAPPAPSPLTPSEQEHLATLGNVGAEGRAEHASDRPDPKDLAPLVERYRAAARLGGDRQWEAATVAIRAAIRLAPGNIDLWDSAALFATRAGQGEQALSAYRRILEIDANRGAAHLGAAKTLLALRRFADAADHALAASKGDGDAAAPDATQPDRTQIDAHILLAEIALARRNAAAARDQAAWINAVNEAIPLVDYVEGRVLYDRGRLADASPLFERAMAEADPPDAIPGLAFYAGETLRRLKRYEEAEPFLLEAMRLTPYDTRARLSAAQLYRASERQDDAGRMLQRLIALTPMPETLLKAAAMWDEMGFKDKASEARALARRVVSGGGPPSRPANLPVQ